MKKIIYTLVLTVCATAMIFAQEVEEKEMTMSLGTQNGFYIDIDGPDEDITEDVVKKYIKEYGKVKRNKKAKEYFSPEIRIPMIGGTDNIALYVKIDEGVGRTSVMAWADKGGAFVNSDDDPKGAKGMESFLTDIYIAAKKKAIEKEMKKEEKELKKMEKHQSKLEKKNKGYHDDIEDANRKIEEAESNIEKNLKEQEDQKMKIEAQKEKVEKVIERLNSVGKE